MGKRKAAEASLKTLGRASKRQCVPTSDDKLSQLSDELLLRIFSYVSISDLTVCQRVSKRFQIVAGDSQLWRGAYYERFVRPRYDRLPRSRKSSYPTKLTRWLDESALLERGKATNWKRQYKLRDRWSRGSCGVSEIPVASRPPVPPLLARLHRGTIFTADSISGLRAWSYKGSQQLLAEAPFSDEPGGSQARPTCLALDSSRPTSGLQRIAIGFEDGSVHFHLYDEEFHTFDRFCPMISSSTKGMRTALAFASPYLLSMSEGQNLTLYRLGDKAESDVQHRHLTPELLTSLKSHTVWNPLSLSLRVTGSRITAAIAYCMPTFNSGWSAGVQELHISPEGVILDSRLASATGQGFSLSSAIASSAPVFSRPTSLSYSHPYLLVSHADNTLTLYMVTSTADSLSVGSGRRLWGHTSSVFGAHVGGRGKAVSISTRGNEIRVWELEGSHLGRASQQASEDFSVRVTPVKQRPADLAKVSETLAARGTARCLLPKAADRGVSDVTRGWVGFDEESVVVLREHEHGRQALAVYDFDS